MAEDIEAVLVRNLVVVHDDVLVVLVRRDQALELLSVFLQVVDGVDELAEELMRFVEDVLHESHVFSLEMVYNMVSLLSQVSHQSKSKC